MPSALLACLVPIESLIRASRSRAPSPISSSSTSLSHNDKEMLQAPNCSNQRDDEEMKLSHTRDTRHEIRERHQASKQATSNKKQQEPIDEGTKNSTSLPQPLRPIFPRFWRSLVSLLAIAHRLHCALSPLAPHTSLDLDLDAWRHSDRCGVPTSSIG